MDIWELQVQMVTLHGPGDPLVPASGFSQGAGKGSYWTLPRTNMQAEPHRKPLGSPFQRTCQAGPQLIGP